MNVRILFRTMVMLSVVVGLVAASQAFGQGVRDAGSKMRGDYGGPSRSMARARSYYRPSAPMIVRDAAPEVAQTPSGERRYSVEPTPQAAPCPHGQMAPVAPETAERAPSTRRYSYEPDAEATRVYRAPAMRRGFGGSGIPDAGAKMRGDYGR